MTYDELIDSRVRELMSEWPTLDTAFGCENCRSMIRKLDEHGRCPRCGSESVYDVAMALSVERDVVSVEKLRPLVEMLEAVVDL
jgi:transcription elongation factor Elf1